eukprot:1161696-Pelagomonas_calceolata.AAC.35
MTTSAAWNADCCPLLQALQLHHHTQPLQQPHELRQTRMHQCNQIIDCCTCNLISSPSGEALASLLVRETFLNVRGLLTGIDFSFLSFMLRPFGEALASLLLRENFLNARPSGWQTFLSCLSCPAPDAALPSPMQQPLKQTVNPQCSWRC